MPFVIPFFLEDRADSAKAIWDSEEGNMDRQTKDCYHIVLESPKCRPMDISPRELSEELCCSVNTIKSRLFSADCDSLDKHIKAFVNSKLFVDCRQAIFIFSVKIVHILKPMRSFHQSFTRIFLTETKELYGIKPRNVCVDAD